MGRDRKLVPTAPSAPKPPKRPNLNEVGMLQCDKHGDNIYYWYDQWEESTCPACEQIKLIKEKYAGKNRQLRKEVKLLKYELTEERMLHKGTQLEAADYLANKRLVDNLVKDRLK